MPTSKNSKAQKTIQDLHIFLLIFKEILWNLLNNESKAYKSWKPFVAMYYCQ